MLADFSAVLVEISASTAENMLSLSHFSDTKSQVLTPKNVFLPNTIYKS